MGKLAKSSQAKMTKPVKEKDQRYPMCHYDEYGERWNIFGTVKEHFEWEKKYGGNPFPRETIKGL